VTERLGAFLDEENEARMDQILARGERAMANLELAAGQMAKTGARMEELLGGEGRKVLASADGLIGDTRRMMQGNRTQIDATMADLREAARSFRRMAQNLEQDPSRLLFRRRAGERENP